MSEPIYKQVMRDVEARAEVGKKTYGRYLVNDPNGRDPLQDAYEEALDMAKYLKQTGHGRRALLEYVGRLEGALKGVCKLRKKTEATHQAAYEAMFKLPGRKVFEDAADALAATPADSLAAHDAAVKVALLREVAEKLAEMCKKLERTRTHPITWEACEEWILAEADRIEKEAANG